MALDLAVLDAEGRPECVVEISVGEHRALLGAAQPWEAFPVVHRLDDYYADAVFVLRELPRLTAELHALAVKGHQTELITRLLQLCAAAGESGRGIQALAD